MPMELIPCPRCRVLCSPQTERCERCGCAVRAVVERQRKLVRRAVVVAVILFLLLLANSLYWATKL